MLVRLTDLCNIQYGYAFDSGCFTDDENYMPLVRIRDVKRGFSETYYSGEYPEEYILHAGDLLIGMDGEFNIARWKSRDALLNQRVCKVSAKDGVCEEYLRFALSKELKGIEDRTAFVTVKHLSAKELNKLEMHVPEISEQQQIADTLDKIESIIEKRQRELNKLDELIKARFVEMFGSNTKKRKLQEYADLITKGASPKWQGVDYCDEGVLFITSENVREGYIDFSKQKCLPETINQIQSRSVLKRNDILINIVNASIGRAAIFDSDVSANINQAVALVRTKQENINLKFLLTYLNSDEAHKAYDCMKVGGDKSNLSLKNISDLLIPDVEIERQNQFAIFLEQVDKSKVVFLIQENNCKEEAQ